MAQLAYKNYQVQLKVDSNITFWNSNFSACMSTVLVQSIQHRIWTALTNQHKRSRSKCVKKDVLAYRKTKQKTLKATKISLIYMSQSAYSTTHTTCKKSILFKTSTRKSFGLRIGVQCVPKKRTFVLTKTKLGSMKYRRRLNLSLLATVSIIGEYQTALQNNATIDTMRHRSKFSNFHDAVVLNPSAKL